MFAPARFTRPYFPRLEDLSANLGLFLGFAASLAFAGETAVSLMNAGMPAECAEYAANVSRSEGSFTSVSPVVNGTRCYGAFQFCDGTISRYWSGSATNFLGNPAAQVSAWQIYQSDQWKNAIKAGLDRMLGQQVCYGGTCAIITQSSILKACQFGCAGTKSKLYNLAKANLDCGAPNTRDGAGTSVCSYLISGTGFNVSCVTGNNDGIDCRPTLQPL